MITSRVVARTALMRSAAPFPVGYGTTFYEDYAVWLRLAQLTRIAVLDELLVRYQDPANDHYSSRYAADPVFLRNTCYDFSRWRLSQRDTPRWSWAQRSAATRHLVRRVSVRDLARWAAGPRRSGVA